MGAHLKELEGSSASFVFDDRRSSGIGSFSFEESEVRFQVSLTNSEF